MEDRLDLPLQLPGHHRLRDPISHGGHPQSPGAPPCGFGISTARTGGGKYDPDDIRFQILYRLLFRSFSNSSIDCPSTPGAPLFALTFSHASQTARFEISNGLPDDFNSSTRLLPDSRPVDRTNTATNNPAPSLHPHYRGFTTTTSRSASAPRDGTHSLTVSAASGYSLSPTHTRAGSVGARLLLFHAKAADRARVAYMPDTAWPISGHPPDLSREPISRPGFDVIC